MDTNEYNRRIRYALQLDDAEAHRLTLLGGKAPTPAQIVAWRKKEEEDDFEICPVWAITALLDGLITDLRGPPPETAATNASKNQTPSSEKPEKIQQLDNNSVLKQIRIALSLRTDDIHSLIVSGGGKLGKTEVNAFFRNPQARNYRRCGDQVIRWFLTGLAKDRRD